MYLQPHCSQRSWVPAETRPLMMPVWMPFQLSHCRAIPSCVSKPFISSRPPEGFGTWYSLPSVMTPSTSIRSSLTPAAIRLMFWSDMNLKL